jgi:ABC-type transport system involved in cytochrome bd biosynthesis fused ATPase/permease subunit
MPIETPAVAVCLGPQGLDQRQKREVGWALAWQAQEEQQGRAFPLIPVFLPGADLAPAFRLRHAWVDLRHNLADPLALDRLAQVASHGTAPLRPIAALVDFCPYRGLQAFREEDAAFFFGREALTARLSAEVATHNLVALVGPAGSGKSSLINAGLLPLLRDEGGRMKDENFDSSFIPHPSSFPP